MEFGGVPALSLASTTEEGCRIIRKQRSTRARQPNGDQQLTVSRLCCNRSFLGPLLRQPGGRLPTCGQSPQNGSEVTSVATGERSRGYPTLRRRLASTSGWVRPPSLQRGSARRIRGLAPMPCEVTTVDLGRLAAASFHFAPMCGWAKRRCPIFISGNEL